jgi:elongation factor G
VGELLDVIERLLPNPTEGNPPQFFKGEGATRKPMHAVPDPAQHVIAHVFKVTVDPYVGKMGVFRIHQGTVTRDSQLYIGDGRKPFKVGHLFMLQGKEHVEVPRGVPGDICAVAKVDELHFDAVLHDAAEDDHLHLKPLPFPGAGARPGDRAQAARRRAAHVGDPAEARRRRPVPEGRACGATNETVVYGLGELHLRTCSSAARGLQVRGQHAAAAHRLPRDGHRLGRRPPPAQEADRRRRPVRRGVPARRAAARGAGFEFVDQVKGGTIPGSSSPRSRKACARCWRPA